MRNKTSQGICQVFCFNKEKVARIKKIINSEAQLDNLVEMLKAISDKTRIKILLALKENELCVCDITHILGLSVSAISHQLRILRGLKIIKYRNQGKLVFYSLKDKHIEKLIENLLGHTKECLF